jgi:hypothetical protein
LVQDRGGAKFLPLHGIPHLIFNSLWVETGGILLYVEDFKLGSNPAKGGRPKDIFEMDSTFSVYNDLIIRIIVNIELFFDECSEQNLKRRNAHGSIKSSLAD